MQQAFLVALARAGFVTLCCLLGISLALGFGAEPWVGALCGTGFGCLMIAIDRMLKHLTIRGFSSATFGLMIGILCAWLVTQTGIFESMWMRSLKNFDAVRDLAQLALFTSMGFFGISLAVRSDREEFSFVIPYVRFRQKASLDRPLLLDTNVIIDGRIRAVCEAGFLTGSLVVPQFVLDELHRLADSRDATKSERGKTGLDELKLLQEMPAPGVVVLKVDQIEEEVETDSELVRVARKFGASIISNDTNLRRVAELQNVTVLNLNDLAIALHPRVVTGDEFNLTLSKRGREEHQAVGYLDDGTMIVVNGGIGELGNDVRVRVTTQLQTTAGRLAFAELIG
jgi:uncharacterized protein YacL